MADSDSRAPRSLLHPMNRRRRRSPSDDGDEELAETSERASTDEPTRRRREPWKKRRRLNTLTQSTAALPTPIKYGHYGQVEPGRLQLEIISCDGGEHVDPRHPSLYLGAKNVLKHDKSVYCSERASSGLVLRHVDDTPFCLEKLHVVGPEHGFTAPVREGLVYVAMTLNDLQKYMDPPPHARRQGVDGPPYRQRRLDPPRIASLRASPEQLTLADALRDPEVNAALGRNERDYAGGADTARDLASAAQESYYGDDFGFGRTDPEAHCEIPTGLSSDGPDVILNAEGEHVPVTVLTDDEVGPEETSSQEVLDFRLQRLRSMRRRYEIENWDREDRWAGINGLHFEANSRDQDRESSYGLGRLDALMARSRMHDSPPPMNPRDETVPPVPSLSTSHRRGGRWGDMRIRPDVPRAPQPEHYDGQLPTQPSLEPTRPPPHVATNATAENDSNVTCARFSIKKGKHKVAIKFDPGISGRFILLKLWGSLESRNVDVQSVVAKGFGGPRFFPAREAV